MKNLIDYEKIEFDNGSGKIKKIKIWEGKASVFCFDGPNIKNLTQAVAFVKEEEEKINTLLNWVEDNRKLFEKEMIDSGIKDRAEDWQFEVLEFDSEEEADLFEITDEEFWHSMCYCDMIIDLSKKGFDELFIEITLDPDYFNGHLIHGTLENGVIDITGI